MKNSILYSAIVFGLLLATSASELHAQVGNNNPTGVSGAFNGTVTTGCSYDPYTANATRAVTDLVVAGAVGEYGLSFSRTWNSRTGGWQTSYDWSIDEIDDIPYTDPIAYTVRFPDGRAETFTSTGAQGGYWPTTAGVPQRFKPWDGTFAYLILADGGKVKFQATRTSYYDGEKHQWLYSFYFTAVALIDPYGLVTTFSDGPDGSFQVTEPAGRWIRIYNGYPGVLDHITASDGREVHYTWQTQYFGAPSLPHTVLTSVVYFFDSSLTATYTYSSTRQGFIVLATANDPMYAGPMKNISYDYKGNPNPDGSAQVAGQIENEKSGLTGDYYVTTLTVTGPTTRTETRGDGRQRTFTYDTNGYLLQWTDFKNVSSYQSYDSKKYVASITDGNGHTTNYTNNPLTGLVTQIQYPATPNDTTPSSNNRGTVTYTYGSQSCPDPNNQDPYYPYYLYSVTDEAGNATIVTRDTNKRITRIDHPDTGYETFSYNSFGQVLSHRMKTGGMETFTYDGRGLRQTFCNPDNATGNPTARYQYDARDRVFSITDVLGSGFGDPQHATQYDYNARGQVTVTTLPTDPVDGTRHTITNAYNPNGDGTLMSVTDQLLHTISYTYDDYRRLRSTITPPRSTGDSTHTTSFSYDRAQGTADDYTHTDANVTRLTKPSGNIVQTTYDENYRRKDVVASSGGGTDLAKTSYGYDNAGNLTSMVAPDEQPGGTHAGLSTTWAYDERNRLKSATDALNHITSYTYDLGGHKKTVTQPNTQVITYDQYDSMNRLLQQTVQQTNLLNAVTQYTYEPATGLHVTMKDPHLVQIGSSDVYTFEYDVMGRAKNLTYPTDSGGLHRTESRTYDTAGRQQTYTNRDGKVQTFSYDNLHRQTGFTWSAASAPSVSFLYDAASRTTAINTVDATISRTYFDDNLLQTETETPTGGSANTVTYAWTADGNRQSILYPSLKTYKFNYTGRNQLKQVQENASPFHYQAEYVYDANGNVATRKVGVDVTSFSVTTDASQRDALGRCTHLAHQFPAGSGGTRTLDYAFDAMSNRTSIQRDAGTTDLYDYDLAQQVKTGVDSGNPHTYGYDANGNRTTLDGAGNFTTNNLNQQTSFNGFAVSYDNNGNVGSSGISSLSNCVYDAQNRLTSVTFVTTQTTFKYDGLNRKISQTVDGATTYNVWDGWRLIEERGAGNTLINSYVHGAGEIIERINGSTASFYYQDGLGSTSHLADATGALQESYKYNTFGQATVSAPDGTIRKGGSIKDVRHLFTGQLWMPTAGLYDYRNRVFSPSLTRFLQPDPIGFAGDPSNLYRYCNNDPIDSRDPSGLWAGIGPDPRLYPQNAVLSLGTWNFSLGTSPSGSLSSQGFLSSSGGFPTGGGGYGGDPNQGGGRGTAGGYSSYQGVSGMWWVVGWEGASPSSFPDSNFGFGPGTISMGPGPGPIVAANSWNQFRRWLDTPATREQAAWTDTGRVPTLIAVGIFAMPALAPESGAALVAYGSAAGAAIYDGVESAAMTAIGAGIVGYQSLMANPQVTINATDFTRGFFSPGAPPVTPMQAYGAATRDMINFYSLYGH